jgi:neurexin
MYALGEHGNFFGIEIHNRFLNAYFKFGLDKYIRHEVTRESVSSGRAHQLEIEIESDHILFKFDEKTENFLMISNTLIIDGPLIIGGLYPNHTRAHIPPYFYSGILSNGFVGCIHDLEINGKYLNLQQAALNEGVSGVGTDMCVQMPNQCDIGHCMNDGLCNEGWNRFKCDCSATGYNGPICNQRKKTIFIEKIFF